MRTPTGSPISNLLRLILDSLFLAEDRRLENSVSRLLREHNKVSRRMDTGFLFNGIYFQPPGQVTPAAQKQPLAYELQGEGLAFLKDKATVDLDRQLIQQSLLHLLMPCATPQDIRDALPECLRDTLTQDINNLPRTRPEAYTLEPGSRPHRQYEEILPKIEFFSAARLLY